MGTDATREILTRLVENTESGEVEWALTAFEDQYITRVGGASLRLEREQYHDEDGVDYHTYNLEVCNDDGLIVTAFGPNDFSPNELASVAATPTQAFARLYDLAHRQARRVDHVIDDVLTALRGKESRTPSVR